MRIAVTLDRDAAPKESNDYVRALQNAGASPQEILVLRPGDPLEGHFDGVLLGGGADVDPERYGQKPQQNARVKFDRERDEVDFALFRKAREAGIPVLGICRGLQVINVALGGTLVQDLPSKRPSEVIHRRAEKEKTRRDHAVEIAPGTRLAAIAKEGKIDVNSRHHQAIDELAPDLVVSAKAPDGVAEAVESREDPWLLAVQWHPENLAVLQDGVSEQLFEEFVRAARERSRRAVSRLSG